MIDHFNLSLVDITVEGGQINISCWRRGIEIFVVNNLRN